MDISYWDVIVEVPALWDRHFTYSCRSLLEIPYGAKVRVPFGASTCDGYVVGRGTPPGNLDIKEIAEIYDLRFLPPPELLYFGRLLAEGYSAPLTSVWSCFWPPVAGRKKVPDADFEQAPPPGTRPATEDIFSPAKKEMGRPREEGLEDGCSQAVLVRGTREFRWNHYLDRIKECLEKGLQALILVPEISCIPYAAERLKSLPGDVVSVIHSELTGVTRRNAWLGVLSGEKPVALGTRSAAFLPVTGLGLIVVDEEESDFHKSPEGPFYHARTVARLRAQAAGAELLFGTSHPSVLSYRLVSEGRFSLVDQDRSGKSVDCIVVDLKGMPRFRGIIAPQTEQHLKQTFSLGENAFLFLNRRGDSTQVTCEDCGHVLMCPMCKAPLVRHSRNSYLVCHTCGRKESPPERCPNCGGHRWRFSGFGIERAQREFVKKFPDVPVVRIDSDTARDGPADRALQGLEGAGPVCLLGTQMALNLCRDVPRLGLVGVLSSDSLLNLPDFMASEKVYHLLCKLKELLEEGRPGSAVGSAQGAKKRFVLQTLNPHHHAVAGLSDPVAFYEEELANREALGYPPFGSMFKVSFVGKQEGRVEEAAGVFAGECMKRSGDINVLGPSPAPKSKVRGNYIWQVALRGQDQKTLSKACLDAIAKASGVRGVRVSVDSDPVSMS